MGVKVFIKQFLQISLAKAMKLDLDMQWASNVISERQCICKCKLQLEDKTFLDLLARL